MISSRSVLETTLAQMRRRFEEGDVPLPSFWGGYRVQPQTIEFWQSRPDRLHDRYQYTRQTDNSWTIDRLAP
ncbi:MAG: hypothetical protein Ct9H300mP16_19610 [Pseudomonadota bacterium]|nr:MAG: hypothetical protein Ct9H300mP16_19610 [Pseudomonadota bacterium]